MRHDYLAFARNELPAREALGYPPYGVMARIIARGASDTLVAAYLEQVAESLKRLAEAAADNVRFLGPAPAPIPRLRGEHRRHLQILASGDDTLRQLLRDGWQSITPPDGVRSIADLDPIDML